MAAAHRGDVSLRRLPIWMGSVLVCQTQKGVHPNACSGEGNVEYQHDEGGTPWLMKDHPKLEMRSPSVIW